MGWVADDHEKDPHWLVAGCGRWTNRAEAMAERLRQREACVLFHSEGCQMYFEF